MNPLLESAGQLAAIVICLFVFVFVILAVAVNLGMALGLSWVSEKINMIKLLRPTVTSVNKASESALQGVPPDQNQNGAIRTAASIPARMHGLEKKVDQGTDKVANAVIEFHARTVQAQTILKTFFLPGLHAKEQEQQASVDQTGMEFNSPGYQMLMKEKPEVIPAELPSTDGYTGPIAPVEQVQHAATR